MFVIFNFGLGEASDEKLLDFENNNGRVKCELEVPK